MTTSTPFAEDRTRQAALLARLAEAGYPPCDPPILQPAAAFVESGEDMRGRLFLTQGPDGVELCLRPEFTIPVCRQYLAARASDVDGPGRSAGFSYCGPVFRLRRDGPGEFLQAGIESLGRADREAADAEVLALSLDAAALVAPADYETVIGDAGLFSDLLDRLAIPAQWRRRITRGLAQGKTLDAVLDAPRGGVDHSGVLAALEGVDRKGARALVEDLLTIAGIATVGGRTAAEIAERFLEQAALRDGSGLTARARDAIARFLAIAGEPDAAADDLRRLAAECGLDLSAALDRFESRLNFIVARDVDLGRLRFSARFLRNLDYYTGFIFEVRDGAKPAEPPLVGGGRYDRLAGVLGSDREVPAVGAALWVDRLAPIAAPDDAAPDDAARGDAAAGNAVPRNGARRDA